MHEIRLSEFLKEFSSDEKCLEEIKNLRFPDGIFCETCKKVTNHYKLGGRKAYSCEFCRSQVHPLAQTIFEHSSTPLTLWFYAIFLMTKTRSGVSARQLHRELGVTYKTAWRMWKQIRMLMAESGGGLLEGIVEMDETFVGGKGKNRAYEWRGLGEKPKEVLMGMVQRGGKVYMKHVPNTGKWTLLAQIKQHVDPKARIYSDEYASYTNLPQHGYEHDSVTHSAGEYVRGDVHTNNIENVWSHLKRGIYGVYRVVSPKYLQSYADEYYFRYNHRSEDIFRALLRQIAEVKLLKVEQPALG